MLTVLPQIRAALPDDLLRDRMGARQWLHSPGALIAPEDVLSLAGLEEALARGAIGPGDLKVFLADNEIDLELAGAVTDQRLNLPALRSLALRGATLVANNLQRAAPALWDLACDAEGWLGARATIGAIASFGGPGLKVHHDVEDILILQLAGEKQWSFFGGVIYLMEQP